MEEREYQKIIAGCRTKIGLTLFILTIYLGVVFWQLNNLLFQSLPQSGAEIELQQLDLEVIWQELTDRVAPVQLAPTNEAEKGIGKAEPFQ